MKSGQTMTRVLQGKYQITKNIFVGCYLTILEATDEEVRAFVGMKKNTKTKVPVGTKIFFNSSTSASPNQKDFDIFTLTVQKIEDYQGDPLLICSPIQKESRHEQRAQARCILDFPVQLANSSALFIARNGNNQGLTLQYTANRAMISLSLNHIYQFSVHFKEEDYLLPGKIIHIQYDWKSHQHLIGVTFSDLTKEQDTVLNLLVDPAYTVQISDNQTVDTTSGKISLD